MKKKLDLVELHATVFRTVTDEVGLVHSRPAVPQRLGDARFRCSGIEGRCRHPTYLCKRSLVKRPARLSAVLSILSPVCRGVWLWSQTLKSRVLLSFPSRGPTHPILGRGLICGKGTTLRCATTASHQPGPISFPGKSSGSGLELNPASPATPTLIRDGGVRFPAKPFLNELRTNRVQP